MIEFCGDGGLEKFLSGNYKFRHNPKGWPQHKILGRDHDGSTITVGATEMVMNDAFLIDSNRGPGKYEGSLVKAQDSISRKTLQAFLLAKELYGCEPIDLHAGD